MVLWITGLPGSGKSTLAEEIKKAFPEFIVLRMDELRKVVTPMPTYSEEERDIVYRALIFTAKVLSETGCDVLMDATGNLRKWRDLARRLIASFAEVYLRCPLEVCIEREDKRAGAHGAPPGVYKKGRAGWPVPGLSAPYEEPLNPELSIDTSSSTPEEGLKTVAGLIRRLRE